MFQRTSVGLDVHARSVKGCAIDGVTGEISQRTFGRELDPLMGWLASLPGPVLVTYEAGPTGFTLARDLGRAGLACQVAAPSKLLRAVGDRVKTDRRDAQHLAEMTHAGLITKVRIPTLEQEVARDLVRARDDARSDLMRARHRLSKLLLRHGQVWPGKTTWGASHLAWLRGQRFDQPLLQATFDNDLEVVIETLARRDRIDAQIQALATSEDYRQVVARLGCLRGISTLTGLALAVEIGDWHRFTGATIGAYAGLVPSEHSSGASRCQGGITKTGNGHVRRLLVEAAWHHRTRYTSTSPALQARWAKASPAARARADQGNRRLYKQWVTYQQAGKNRPLASAAIARQLAGWCWSLATLE